MNMSTTLALLAASVFAVTSVPSFAADDPVSTPATPAQNGDAKEPQALKYQDAMDKATQDPQGRNIGITKSAAEAKAAKAKNDAAAQKDQDIMIKATQDPQSRNSAINKSAIASKAGPTPRHGTMNTPEADKVLKEQKGQ